MAPSLSAEAGSLELAGERVQGQGRFKIIDLSTPVMAGDPVLKQFALSDQGYIHLPCPLCGHYQPLAWAQVKWGHKTDTKKSVEPEEARRNTWYECTGCGGEIRDRSKRWMLANYKRVAKGQRIVEEGTRHQAPGTSEEKMDPRLRGDDIAGGDDNTEEGTRHQAPGTSEEKMDPCLRRDDIAGGDDNTEEGTREEWQVKLPGGEVKRYELTGGRDRDGGKNRRWGIHFSRLYVPWRPWGEMAKAWLEIEDDLSKRQTFYNAALALPWKVRTLRVDDSKLVKHIWRGTKSLIVPDGYEWITAGVDVQMKEVYYSVWAWREDGARHQIEYGVEASMGIIDVIASTRYPTAAGGREIAVGAVFPDSKYRLTEVEDVCRGHANCHICQGSAANEPGRFGPVSQGYLKTDPVTGRSLPRDKWRSYVSVHPGTFKAELHAGLEIEWDFVEPPEPPGRYVSFHGETEMEFINHLTAEERVEEQDRSGRVSYRWVVKRKANHWLDTTVYAAAAWRWFFTAWVGMKNQKRRKKRVRTNRPGNGILDGLPDLG